MADWGDFLNKRSDLDGGLVRNEEFDEEEVWSVTKERDYLPPKIRVVSKESSGSSSAWHLPTSPKKIPTTKTNLPFSESNSNVVGQGSSAPLDIPDWSKIYGKKGSKDGSWDDDVGDHYHDDYEDEDEHDMVPPHEWIAKKLARSQISSFSVCEGIGRTLKGRDLSKVRNAILTKTGFIE